MLIQTKLISWYLKNKRDFPWRKTKDPYKIWVSEIILQQTKAATGVLHYNKFLKEFPTLKKLAKSSEKKVLKTWEGFGYYSRARNLFHTAKKLFYEYEGQFPTDFQTLKSFRGIGDYTASAIGSICFNLPEGVVDGNVYRLISRVFGINDPININASKRKFKEKVNFLIKGFDSGLFNQAMMEFGALQCIPSNPKCNICPLKRICFSYKNNQAHLFPFKSEKKKIKNRFFNFIVFHNSVNETIIEKRESGIWKNLYQFPLLETKNNIKKISREKITNILKKYRDTAEFTLSKWNKKPIKNILSHQKIEIDFWIVKIDGRIESFIKKESLMNYPMPKVLQNFREKFFLC